MGFDNNCLRETSTVRDALEKLEVCDAKILIVQDLEGKILGVVTDGDMRRGLLKGVSPKDSVTVVMNTKPHVFPANVDRETILNLMRAEKILQAILVDDGKVVGIETIDSLTSPLKRENRIIIMAGGLGTRLHPLTKNCPKPLIEVAGKPVIEWIIEKCIGQGFYKFYVSVNYLSSKVIDYLGDGSRFGADISYLHEEEKLGTAGALGLIKEKQELPLIVINGDILTTLDFNNLLRFHEEHKSDATMVVRISETQIPYGVVYADDHKLSKIVEKPIQQHMISAGIYVIEQSVLDYIEHGVYVDMPEVFNKIIDNNMCATIFPVGDYWIDIGRMDDLEQARSDAPLFT